MCQRVISEEGSSSHLSPRRLRAKYTLRTKLRFVLRGFRPCRGQIHAGVNLQSENPRLYLSMPLQRTGERMLLLLTATFWDKYAATSTGLRRSPRRLSESDSRELPRYGNRFAMSRLIASDHKESSGGKMPGKEKVFII